MTLDWHDIDRWITGESWVDAGLLRHLEALCDDIGARWATSEAEALAASYILDHWQRQSLSNVHREEFEFETWDPGTSAAYVRGEPAFPIDSLPLLFSPRTSVEARLVDVGFGSEHEVAASKSELGGAIAIIDAGFEPFTRPHPLASRVEWLADAGVAAVVVVDGRGGRILSYISGSDWTGADIPSALPVPAIVTSREDGNRLRRRNRGDTYLRLSIDSGVRTGQSVNTVADLPGVIWPDEQIILCAHHDTVPQAPGANDDASGVSVTMEIARVLSRLHKEQGIGPGCTIRFVTFGGEEQMLQGSRAYVRDHYGSDRIPRLVINLDELAVGPMKGIVLQFPELRSFIQRQMDTMDDGLRCHVLELMDLSGDGFPFARRGTPAAFLWRWRFAGRYPDANYGHSNADTVEKVKVRDLKEYVGLTARLLLRLSRVPLEEWPPNTLDVRQIEARLTTERGQVMRVM